MHRLPSKCFANRLAWRPRTIALSSTAKKNQHRTSSAVAFNATLDPSRPSPTPSTEAPQAPLAPRDGPPPSTPSVAPRHSVSFHANSGPCGPFLPFQTFSAPASLNVRGQAGATGHTTHYLRLHAVPASTFACSPGPHSHDRPSYKQDQEKSLPQSETLVRAASATSSGGGDGTENAPASVSASPPRDRIARLRKASSTLHGFRDRVAAALIAHTTDKTGGEYQSCNAVLSPVCTRTYNAILEEIMLMHPEHADGLSSSSSCSSSFPFSPAHIKSLLWTLNLMRKHRAPPDTRTFELAMHMLARSHLTLTAAPAPGPTLPPQPPSSFSSTSTSSRAQSSRDDRGSEGDEHDGSFESHHHAMGRPRAGAGAGAGAGTRTGVELMLETAWQLARSDASPSTAAFTSMLSILARQAALSADHQGTGSRASLSSPTSAALWRMQGLLGLVQTHCARTDQQGKQNQGSERSERSERRGGWRHWAESLPTLHNSDADGDLPGAETWKKLLASLSLPPQPPSQSPPSNNPRTLSSSPYNDGPFPASRRFALLLAELERVITAPSSSSTSSPSPSSPSPSSSSCAPASSSTPAGLEITDEMLLLMLKVYASPYSNAISSTDSSPNLHHGHNHDPSFAPPPAPLTRLLQCLQATRRLKWKQSLEYWEQTLEGETKDRQKAGAVKNGSGSGSGQEKEKEKGKEDGNGRKKGNGGGRGRRGRRRALLERHNEDAVLRESYHVVLEALAVAGREPALGLTTSGSSSPPSSSPSSSFSAAVLHLVDLMRSDGLELDRRVFLAILRAHALSREKNAVNAMLTWLMRMKYHGLTSRRDIETYTAVMDAFALNGDVQQALSWFKRMKTLGILDQPAACSSTSLSSPPSPSSSVSPSSSASPPSPSSSSSSIIHLLSSPPPLLCTPWFDNPSFAPSPASTSASIASSAGWPGTGRDLRHRLYACLLTSFITAPTPLPAHLVMEVWQDSLVSNTISSRDSRSRSTDINRDRDRDWDRDRGGVYPGDLHSAAAGESSALGGGGGRGSGRNLLPLLSLEKEVRSQLFELYMTALARSGAGVKTLQRVLQEREGMERNARTNRASPTSFGLWDRARTRGSSLSPPSSISPSTSIPSFPFAGLGAGTLGRISDISDIGHPFPVSPVLPTPSMCMALISAHFQEAQLDDSKDRSHCHGHCHTAWQLYQQTINHPAFIHARAGAGVSSSRGSESTIHMTPLQSSRISHQQMLLVMLEGCGHAGSTFPASLPASLTPSSSSSSSLLSPVQLLERIVHDVRFTYANLLPCPSPALLEAEVVARLQCGQLHKALLAADIIQHHRLSLSLPCLLPLLRALGPLLLQAQDAEGHRHLDPPPSPHNHTQAARVGEAEAVCYTSDSSLYDRAKLLESQLETSLFVGGSHSHSHSHSQSQSPLQDTELSLGKGGDQHTPKHKHEHRHRHKHRHRRWREQQRELAEETQVLLRDILNNINLHNRMHTITKHSSPGTGTSFTAGTGRGRGQGGSRADISSLAKVHERERGRAASGGRESMSASSPSPPSPRSPAFTPPFTATSSRRAVQKKDPSARVRSGPAHPTNPTSPMKLHQPLPPASSRFNSLKSKFDPKGKDYDLESY